MLSLTTGLNMRTQPSAWWPAIAVYALDFVGHRAMAAGQHIALSSAIQVTRSTSKYALTAAGSYRLFAPNEPALTDAGLSIEPAATNLCTYSNDLSQSVWNRNGVSVSPGYADPAGGNSAFRITEASSSASFSRTATIPVTPGASHSITRIIRRGNFDWLRLTIGDAGFVNVNYLWFDLANAALGGTSAGGTGYGLTNRTITPLADGYRAITVTLTAPTSSMNLSLSSANANFTTTRADVGGGVGMNGYCDHWHTQLEVGSVSSPILTSAATATRNTDNLTVIGRPSNLPADVTYADGTHQLVQPGEQFELARTDLLRITMS